MSTLNERFLGLGPRTENQKDNLKKKYELSKEGVEKRKEMASNASSGGVLAKHVYGKFHKTLGAINKGKANSAARAIKNQQAADDSRNRAAEIKKKYADIKKKREAGVSTANKDKNGVIKVNV